MIVHLRVHSRVEPEFVIRIPPYLYRFAFDETFSRRELRYHQFPALQPCFHLHGGAEKHGSGYCSRNTRAL